VCKWLLSDVRWCLRLHGNAVSRLRHTQRTCTMTMTLSLEPVKHTGTSQTLGQVRLLKVQNYSTQLHIINYVSAHLYHSTRCLKNASTLASCSFDKHALIIIILCQVSACIAVWLHAHLLSTDRLTTHNTFVLTFFHSCGLCIYTCSFPHLRFRVVEVWVAPWRDDHVQPTTYIPARRPYRFIVNVNLYSASSQKVPPMRSLSTIWHLTNSLRLCPPPFDALARLPQHHLCHCVQLTH